MRRDGVSDREGKLIAASARTKNPQFRTVSKTPLTSIELFSGAGGLALGTRLAGFHHRALFEWNRHACESLRKNSHRLGVQTRDHIHEGDVRLVDFSSYAGNLDLLAGGAPCQPFSLAGKHKASGDDRNMFPEVFRAVAETLPRAVVLENVKGLLRASFAPYFNYILQALSDPTLTLKPGESWREHSERLERSRTRARRVRYKVNYQLLNAADFGVPQKRERVFIVAFREDLGVNWEGIQATHSQERLWWDKWVSGLYWAEHALDAPRLNTSDVNRVKRLFATGEPPITERWRTVRDGIVGLGDPAQEEDDDAIRAHRFVPGARIYPGHTGSVLDEPAKTLKAGDHGVPGGENMIRFPDGSVRYLSVREAARMQTFPDDFVFSGPWTENLRQLGNAVPVTLASVVAESVRRMIEGHTRERSLSRKAAG